jgi:hypothetical protein
MKWIGGVGLKGFWVWKKGNTKGGRGDDSDK